MNAILAPYKVLRITDKASFRKAVEAYLGDPNATEWLPGPGGSGLVAIAYKIQDSPLTDSQIIQQIVKALRDKGSHNDRAAESRIAEALSTDQLTVHWWNTGLGGNSPPSTAWPILLNLVEKEKLDPDLADHLRRRIAARNGNGKQY